MNIKEVLKENILVLDGAIGTMIQKYSFNESDFRGREFMTHPVGLKGFNDILNLTKPDSIKNIHLSYLDAGANIITSNTFNSNAVSMADYGLADNREFVKRLNREGISLVKDSIEKYREEKGEGFYFASGSIGPTNRSLSMSPDITDPEKRNITFEELKDAYIPQIEGLIEGGADLLLCETFFDTLNLKAALGAANHVMKEKGVDIPLIVSATVSDNTGRILSGQSLKAFVTSINDFDNVLAIGVNCGFGPERMENLLRDINSWSTHYTSCHPNAGLPDESGCYNVSSDQFCRSMEKLLENESLNIVGGCCGTTPEHIGKLSALVKNYKPKRLKKEDNVMRLSGLDMLELKDGFTVVGERCNVAGSAKFLRLVKENLFEEAAGIAKSQIEKGAEIIDINLDDPLLNARDEMVRFVRYILAEPEVAKVPFMIDSSKWEVIEGALQNIQGKGLVNSLSLKEGEEKFIERARKVKELGFALVVMAFDEEGQADTYKRKIEVCERSYRLLTERCGYRPEDIVFDVNVMTIATGMKEHARYAIDFIKAVEWIKKNLPGVRTSGGISNLSFAFRGKNKLREYMHVVFLHHAIKSGLDMAIINPSLKTRYEDVPEDIRDTIEAVIFDTDPDAVDRLVELANSDILQPPSTPKKKETAVGDIKENSDVSTLLINDLIRGELRELEPHLSKAIQEIKDPVKIIEGPLMEGMKRVGDLFGEGKMFLPQVVKTARAMKHAVDILTPEIQKLRNSSVATKSGKIIVATVKGDVHDIGKNIVATVLSCNNYEIIDLGIMVPSEKIVEVCRKEKPDFLCLSGLITPSLGEMIETVRELKRAGIKIPVMVGGAATSLLHTALKISPEYDGPVFHMADASQNPIAASRWINEETREDFIKETQAHYKDILSRKKESSEILPFKEVLEIAKERRKNQPFAENLPEISRNNIIIEIQLSQILPLVNWKMFFLAWKLQGLDLEKFPFSNKEADKIRALDETLLNRKEQMQEGIRIYEEALQIIEKLERDESYDGKALLTIASASSDEKNIYIGGKEFPMLRQQRSGSDLLSCCDFIKERDMIGLFVVTAGHRIYEMSKEFEGEGDLFKSLIAQTLADRLVEASAEWLQAYVNETFMPVTIRPAWGYPMLPDQTEILETESFLNYEKIGVSLTSNGAMYPPASISGLFIAERDAKYFMIGEICEDQLIDYAKRRGMDSEKLRLILRQR